MIEHEGKPLEELTLEETIEFEKAMLKKVLAASKAQMSGGILDQINLFIDLIRDHKTQLAQKELYDKNEKDRGNVLNIGEIEAPPNADVEGILSHYKTIPKANVDEILSAHKAKSVEELLDFYKKK